MQGSSENLLRYKITFVLKNHTITFTTIAGDDLDDQIEGLRVQMGFDKKTKTITEVLGRVD